LGFAQAVSLDGGGDPPQPLAATIIERAFGT